MLSKFGACNNLNPLQIFLQHNKSQIEKMLYKRAMQGCTTLRFLCLDKNCIYFLLHVLYN